MNNHHKPINPVEPHFTGYCSECHLAFDSRELRTNEKPFIYICLDCIDKENKLQ